MESLPHTFEIRIPSSRKNINRVEEFFREVNAACAIPEEKLHALLLSVTEAVNNGIIHGNKSDESKLVTLTCAVNGRSLTVTVRDEGSGFTPANLANPLQEENLLNTGGRGVFLMRAFMKSVEYNDKGNSVTMVMDLDH